MPPPASALSCRRPTAETRTCNWGATLDIQVCTLMSFNLGFIPLEMILSGSCLQRTPSSFWRSAERDENRGPDSCGICKSRGRRPAVEWQAASSGLWPRGAPPPRGAGGQPFAIGASLHPRCLFSAELIKLVSSHSAPSRWYTDPPRAAEFCVCPLTCHFSRLLVMLKEIFTVTHVTHPLCSPAVTRLLRLSQRHGRLL